MHYLKTGIALLVAAGLSTSAAYAHPQHRTSVQSDMSKTYAMIDHNTTKSSARSFNWTKYITVSGLLNVDATYAGHGWNAIVPGFIPGFPAVDEDYPHATDISVNNANLLVDARINHFTTAHVGIVYQDRVGPHQGQLRFGESNNDGTCYDSNSLRSRMHIDEAYVTLANFSREPFYIRVGREFVPFGTYDSPYPITYSLPQLLSQTNATVVQLGYAKSNLHLAAYAFNGALSNSVDSFSTSLVSRVRNYGVQLAYMGSYKNTAYHADVAFIRDIRDATFNAVYFVADDCSGYRRTGGLSAHVDMTRGAFDLKADYVTALRHAYDGGSYDTRHWAYALLGGYTFHTYNHVSKVNLGYQRAGQVDNIVPKYRILADYNVVLGRHTEATVQYVHNKNFSNSHGSITVEHAGQSANVINVRLGVHF